MTEQEMVHSAAKRLIYLGFDIRLELPLARRSIDMSIKLPNNTLIAIEFKKHDWSRACQQCSFLRTSYHYNYICILPFTLGVPQAFLDKASSCDTGIFYYQKDYNYPFELILEAKAQPKVWQPYRDGLLKFWDHEFILDGHRKLMETIFSNDN